MLPFAQRWDYSAAGVRRSVQDSLQRLGLARLDVAYVHHCDAQVHGRDYPRVLAQVIAEALPQLQRLQPEQVCCKLSALWTEAAGGDEAALTRRYGQHIMANFGSERVMWGSDCLVLELAGSCTRWHGVARDLVAASQQRAVFDAVARHQYRL